jgi:hypothetical protein
MAYESNGLFTGQAEKLYYTCNNRGETDTSVKFAEVIALKKEIQKLSKKNYPNPRLFFDFLKSIIDNLEIDNLHEINEKIINPASPMTGSDLKIAKRDYNQQFRNNLARAKSIIDIEVALAILCWEFPDQAKVFYEDHLVDLDIEFERIERLDKKKPSNREVIDEGYEYEDYFKTFEEYDLLEESFTPEELASLCMGLQECLSRPLTRFKLSLGQTHSNRASLLAKYRADESSAKIKHNKITRSLRLEFTRLRLEFRSEGVELIPTDLENYIAQTTKNKYGLQYIDLDTENRDFDITFKGGAEFPTLGGTLLSENDYSIFDVEQKGGSAEWYLKANQVFSLDGFRVDGLEKLYPEEENKNKHYLANTLIFDLVNNICGAAEQEIHFPFSIPEEESEAANG